MQKVKLTHPTMIAGSPVKAGSVVDLDNGLAHNLILRNRATAVAEAQSTEPPASSATKGKSAKSEK